jgi:hypothetical protein
MVGSCVYIAEAACDLLVLMKKFTLPVLLVAIATAALPLCASAQSFQMYGRLDLGPEGAGEPGC